MGRESLRRARRLRPPRFALIGAVAAVALAAAWLMVIAPSPDPEEEAAQASAADETDLAPLPWKGEDRPDPYAGLGKPKFITAKKHGIENMPPASAGSNGSYTPRPAHERERFDVAKHPGGLDPEDAALLLGETAIAPASAPEAIAAVIDAANQITDQPYRWGGGHSGWRSRGYDCSGAVSYALAGGGLIGAPATSGQLMSWGSPGHGKWLTIYANPGHVYAVVAGLRFDTVGLDRGEGPRWHPADAYPDGYVARHIPGL